MCKRTVDNVQTCTNSHVFMGTTRMRQQWCPGRFFLAPAKNARLATVLRACTIHEACACMVEAGVGLG